MEGREIRGGERGGRGRRGGGRPFARSFKSNASLPAMLLGAPPPPLYFLFVTTGVVYLHFSTLRLTANRRNVKPSLFATLSVCWSVDLSVCLLICLLICLSACLSVACLSVYWFVCLFISLCLFCFVCLCDQSPRLLLCVRLDKKNFGQSSPLALKYIYIDIHTYILQV